jgi:hypothetical protein
LKSSFSHLSEDLKPSGTVIPVSWTMLHSYITPALF